MSDLETMLADRLEARADRVPVGPAPVDLMVRRASARRRRPVVVLAAAAASAAVAVGLAVVVPGSESGEAPPAAPSPTATPRPVDAQRYVGEGRVVVPVPDGWGDDARPDRCGTPRIDAVVDHRITGLDCLSERPDGVETIEVLGREERYDPFPAIKYSPREIEIDGIPADISPAFCTRWTATCTVSLWVRSEGVQVVASASTRASAEALAATVEVLSPDAVATKRIGIGHLSVEVPDTWSRDAMTACGTPTADTLITRDGSRACLNPPVAGVESVHVLHQEPVDIGWDPVDLGGVVARRSGGWCNEPAVPTCSISIWVPEAGVGLLVTSHTDMASARAIVDTVSYDPGLVAVPASYRTGSGVPLGPDAYGEVLDEVGLVPEMLVAKLPAGLRVSEVLPDVGTMVPLGSTVQFRVEPWAVDSDKGRF